MGMGKDVILPKFNYVNERLVSVSAPINDVIKILLCFSLRAFSLLKISKAQEYNLRINIREIKTNEITFKAKRTKHKEVLKVNTSSGHKNAHCPRPINQGIR